MLAFNLSQIFVSNFALIFSGASIDIFGIHFNPALLCFLLVFGVFGLLNIIEFKRFD